MVTTLRTDPVLFWHRKGALPAMALIALRQAMPDGYAPIKNKTISIPKRILFGHISKIAQNPAFEVKDLFKALLKQVRTGFFTADSARAKHGHLLVLLRI